MQAKHRLIYGVLILFSLTWWGPTWASQEGWVDPNGAVTYNGAPVCAMVLANGQYAFTCSGDGSFDLMVPPDGNNQLTVYAFCSGKAPYKQVISAGQGSNLQISL